MSKEQAELLDLALAWHRVKDDLRNDRVFVKRPFEQVLFEDDLDGALDSIRNDIERESYAPSPLGIADVPKGKGGIRPGTYLPLRDQVVYAAAVGSCVEAIRAAVHRLPTRVDFSYGLSPAGNPGWLQSRFKGWTAFREQSLRRIRAGASWVVMCDVAACYENVTLRTLTSDLNGIDAPPSAVKLLSTQLSRWSQVGGRGLPQGFSASDILAKLYLSRIDEALSIEGIAHLRYVDDFRLFCTSSAEAKHALVVLARRLRARGLNLQSAKTAIYRADEAHRVIDGIFPILKPLKTRYMEAIAKAAGRNPKYISFREAEELMKDINSEVPLTVVRQAYATYFMKSTTDFNKSLFHYLLNRLAAATDTFAVQHCLSLLEDHPEETDAILKYISAATCDLQCADEALAKYLASEDAVYQYQRYQIVSWRTRLEARPTACFLDLVRGFARDGGSPEYVRSSCWHFLARFGTPADLDVIEQQYPLTTGSLDRSELLCCLARMETSRRNGLLGFAKKDGPLEERAAKLVLSGRLSTSI